VNQAVEPEKESTLKYSVLLMGLVVAGLFQNCSRSFDRVEEKSVAKYSQAAPFEKVDAGYALPGKKNRK
jgi:hypothetical protein